jgi:hypothetical protein
LLLICPHILFLHHVHNQGAQLTRKAKRSSAADHDGSGLLGSVFGRRSAAMPAVCRGSKGSGAPSSRRLRATLAVLALAIAAFAVSASPAFAYEPHMGTISNVSYTSAHVDGKVTSNGEFVTWSFEYSTDEVNWISSPGGGSFTDNAEHDVSGDLEGLKGGTPYFVRLNTSGIFGFNPKFSPATSPYPEFTTLPVDPPSVVSTDNASEVAYTTATVRGKVNRPANADPAFDVDCHFQYVTDQQFNETGFTDNPGDVPCEGTNPIEAPGSSDVEAHLTELANNTKYHLRLFVSNASPTTDAKEAASTFKTLKVDPPSVVSTDNAGEVEYTQAQVKGVVERPTNADPAFDVDCHFQYVTDEQFTTNEGAGEPGFAGAAVTPCNPNPVTEADTAPGTTKAVSATLGGLAPSTTYHLRLAASNKGGADAKEAGATFATLGPVPKPTVLTTDDATDLTFFTAKVSGEVQRPAGKDPALDINCRFEYVTQAQFEAEEFAAAEPNGQLVGCVENPITAASADGEGKQAVTAELTGLKSGATYHLRLVAENLGGTVTKDAANTFTTTPGGEPTVTIDPNPAMGYTTALVSGIIERGLGAGQTENLVALVEAAEVGTENWLPIYGDTAKIQVPVGAGPKPISYEIHEYTVPAVPPLITAGLRPNTEYKFRIDLIGDFSGQTTVFGPPPYATGTTRPLAAPTATINPVTDLTGPTAHFSGTVDTNAPAGPLDDLAKAAYKTEWHFECVPACKDANGKVLGGTIQADEGSQPVAVDATQLVPNTPGYKVKLVAKNVLETGEEEEEFDTPLIKPTVKAAPGASDGNGGYILEGTVNPNNSPVTACEFKWGPNAPVYAFKADCSPAKVGTDEVQGIKVNAISGEFRLSFQGDTTGDISYRAPASTVASALEALPSIGPSAVSVVGGPGNAFGSAPYIVTFGGSLGGTNLSQLQSEDGTVPLSQAAGSPLAAFAAVSTRVEGSIARPVTVEAHLTGLNPGAVYHADLFATNEAGTEDSKDFTFKPTLAVKGPACPNEALREENNSLALPECRAYEKVTPSGKEGFPAELDDYAADTVLFDSFASNLAGSGEANSFISNLYVTVRTATGWETIPNLNGPSGSKQSPPGNERVEALGYFQHYSADFRSSLLLFLRKDGPNDRDIWLQNPDGSLTSVGQGCILCVGPFDTFVGASDDLSHIVYRGIPTWGPGVYEFVGTGNDQPRRVDLDSSGAPISTCKRPGRDVSIAGGRNTVSTDGRVIFVTASGAAGAASCTGTGSPPADEVWARIGGTVSVDASASQCHRTAPADPCNAPSNATFQGAASDGSRVFFSTTQQLLNGDTDETNDIYECDIPSGTPTPVGKGNPCDALREVSGAAPGADVANAYNISEDGSTVYFISPGVLASNKDALGNTAQAGDRNLYAWRTDAAHPDGQTHFLARLTDSGIGPNGEQPQTTPDGRYLVFLTHTPLLATDTDEALDLYRYDVESEELTRVSTGLTGVGGNGPFDVRINNPPLTLVGEAHHTNTAISDDGQKAVFSTPEPLSPVDGNDANDVYLWTPTGVSLITTGSVGGGEAENGGFSVNGTGSGAISSSGSDIFFATAGKLVASDGDQSGDVYDARVDGGFTNPPPACSGEACQSPAPTPPTLKSPGSGQPSSGNPTQPKPCPKGKIRKHGKCVKKSTKKHHHNKSHKNKRTASHGRGGNK